MARGVGVAAFEHYSGAASYFSSAGAFLAAVVCVLAVATVVAALCAKHSRKEDKKRYSSSSNSMSRSRSIGPMESPARSPRNFKSATPKSPGRAIMDTLSSKKLLPIKNWGRSEEEERKASERAAMEKGDFLWQRSILMGERCQPPDFSGVIIYDRMGNRLPEFPPRSPKFSDLHPSLQVKRSFK